MSPGRGGSPFGSPRKGGMYKGPDKKMIKKFGDLAGHKTLSEPAREALQEQFNKKNKKGFMGRKGKGEKGGFGFRRKGTDADGGEKEGESPDGSPRKDGESPDAEEGAKVDKKQKKKIWSRWNKQQTQGMGPAPSTTGMSGSTVGDLPALESGASGKPAPAKSYLANRFGKKAVATDTPKKETSSGQTKALGISKSKSKLPP